MSDNHLTILVVEPGKHPYPRQIPDTLQAMQEIVGGDIDATYPYEDPVALVFNSSGKFAGHDQICHKRYARHWRLNI